MNTPGLLPTDDPISFPSMPTLRGGGASRPGEPSNAASAPGLLATGTTIRGRTTPRGERLHAGDVLLGRYTVLAELGQGGMGVVYRCLDSVGGIEVALKCLPPELSRDETEMEGIRENYAIVARLHHSAISGLRHLEHEAQGGDYYIVMDLAEGEDLARILRRRRSQPMPLSEALDILRPLAAALDYAHGEGVLHRDVKPANVKIRPPIVPGDPPRVQLLDFGLAAQVRSSMSRVSLRGHAGTSGTPSYMAPEQWEARRQGPATDQYALAVMAYEMLAGELPFAADDTDILRRAVLSREPDPVDGLGAAANAALLRALSKEPKDRFPSCAAFVASMDETTKYTKYTKDVAGGAPAPVAPPGGPDSAASEADILSRKVALSRRLAAIDSAERGDARLGALVSEADTELAAAEEAFKYTRFVAAAECLGRAENALDQFDGIKTQRAAEAARKAREEAERRKREDAERKAREAEELRKRDEAVRKNREEEEHRKRDEALRKAHKQFRRRKFRKAAGVVAIMGAVLFAAFRIIDDVRWAEIGRKAREEAADRKMTKIIDLGGGVTLEMLHCPGVAPDFWMGKYEVTQEQWQRVMGRNPSEFGNKPKNPVETVSWNECQEFVKQLNALPAAKNSGLSFRLPNEEEWEAACRAGAPKSADFCKLADGTQITANTLSKVARYNKDRDDEPVAVGSFLPNAWGLYDMHGNVCEWTQTAVGVDRVSRGGSWSDSARYCGSSVRGGDSPDDWSNALGFRLCASGRAAAAK